MANDSGFKPQKEINRIKSQIKKLEREKDKTFPDLGKLAYQAYMEGRLSDPALVEVCVRLKEIDSQVEQANAQVASLQAQVQQMKETKKASASEPVAACQVCGAAVTPGLKFCGNCGAARAQGPPATQAPPAMSCPSCGSPLALNARFCGECGKLLGSAEAPARLSSSDTHVTAPPPAATAPPPPAPPPAPPAPPPTAPVAPGAVKCPACGAMIEEANAQFCGECGAKVG